MKKEISISNLRTPNPPQEVPHINISDDRHMSNMDDVLRPLDDPGPEVSISPVSGSENATILVYTSVSDCAPAVLLLREMKVPKSSLEPPAGQPSVG